MKDALMYVYLLLFGVSIAACAYIPPAEDVEAMRTAQRELNKARELEREVRNADLKGWADQLMLTSMNEITQATMDDLKKLQIEGTFTPENVQALMTNDAALRKKAADSITTRLARSMNLRIYDEVEQLHRWTSGYMARRLSIDQTLYESYAELQGIAASVGVGEYLPDPGSKPKDRTGD